MRSVIDILDLTTGEIDIATVASNVALNLYNKTNGAVKIIALGKITVYPRDGAYQLYCSAMVVDGVGDLYAAFEQLKAKLAAQGLFDPAHKKPIPKYPQTIGIVTSSAGAAIHDMLRILSKRYPLSKVILLPVRVQGVEAPAEIAGAIAYANAHKLADLLIVGRGGGSIEDLWAFNDERVAYAIYESQIPVISAVGHETDFTICDFVADVRASTPSAAAELAVPDIRELSVMIDTLSDRSDRALTRAVEKARSRLMRLTDSRILSDFSTVTDALAQRVTDLYRTATNSYESLLAYKRLAFLTNVGKLEALNPLSVMARGYSVAQKNGRALADISSVNVGDVIKGKVVRLVSFGAFVEVEKGVDGLVHISEISNDFVKDVSRFAKLNDILYAKILDVDNNNKQKY